MTLSKEKRLRQEIELRRQHVTTADINTVFGSTSWAKKRCRHYLNVRSITKTLVMGGSPTLLEGEERD